MTPVANFQISPVYLTVSFTDLSTGTPASWAWNFGDSTTSTSQNPSHTYSTSGTYNVTLTVTNADGSSSLQRQLIVSTVPILPVSVNTFTLLKLPSSLSVPQETVQAYNAQWQLFIQPLVNPVVDISNTFIESAYPPLANALIALLSAYSIVSDAVIGASMAGASAGVSGNPGIVKKVTTGPSDVTFQDGWEYLKNLKDVMAQLSNEICALGFRLMVSLPMCPKLPKVVMNQVLAQRHHHHSFRLLQALNHQNIANGGPINPWQCFPEWLFLTI